MSAAGGRRPVGVAVAGFGWMGRVHTQAYARVLHHFPELPLAPELVAVADEVPGRAEEAAAQFGFATATRDWRELAANPGVQAVSITAPNFLHREIGVAMAQAGKHLWMEKPVGLTTDDARAVADTAVFVPERARPTTYQDQPVSTVRVGPGNGQYGAFQPGSAIAMGFDDLKVIEAWNFLRSIAEGTPHGTTLADAVRSAATLDAMASSAETGAWVKVANR